MAFTAHVGSDVVVGLHRSSSTGGGSVSSRRPCNQRTVSASASQPDKLARCGAAERRMRLERQWQEEMARYAEYEKRLDLETKARAETFARDFSERWDSIDAHTRELHIGIADFRTTVCGSLAEWCEELRQGRELITTLVNIQAVVSVIVVLELMIIESAKLP
eukprot:jgi/Chlat1/7581/Chrsp63S07073